MNSTEKALKHYRAILKAAAEPPVSKEVVEYTREAIGALEKQVAKGVIVIKLDRTANMHCCTCKNKEFIANEYGIRNTYCGKCGQRLKWEE